MSLGDSMDRIGVPPKLKDEESIDARTFLEMVSGTRCPCGHSKEEHDTRPGEDFGPCYKCECQGLIQPLEEENA